jgi:hypothetical protein
MPSDIKRSIAVEPKDDPASQDATTGIGPASFSSPEATSAEAAEAADAAERAAREAEFQHQLSQLQDDDAETLLREMDAMTPDPPRPPLSQEVLEWKEQARIREAARLKSRLSTIPFYAKQAAKYGEGYWLRMAESYDEGDPPHLRADPGGP